MMTSPILRGLFMSDGPPTDDRAVSTFLDYLALACIFGFVESLREGKWLIAVAALVAAIVCHIAGIKWPQIKARIGTRFDWALWNRRIGNAAHVLRVLLIFAAITLAVTAYYEIRRKLVDHTEKPSNEGSPKVQNAAPAP